MATNLHIDEKLLAQALEMGGHKTKRAAVEAALSEYVSHRKRMEIIKLFGTIEYEPGMDPISVRKRVRKAMKPPRRAK